MTSIRGHRPHESAVCVFNVAICNRIQQATTWLDCGREELELLLTGTGAISRYCLFMALTLAEWSCFVQVSVSQAGPLTGTYQLKPSTTVVGDHVSV